MTPITVTSFGASSPGLWEFRPVPPDTVRLGRQFPDTLRSQTQPQHVTRIPGEDDPKRTYDPAAIVEA